MNPNRMVDLTELSRIASSVGSDAKYVEMRYHDKSLTEVGPAGSKKNETRGLSIRVIVNGAWGFASTSDMAADGIREAMRKAVRIAKVSSPLKARQVPELAPARLAVGKFEMIGKSIATEPDLTTKQREVKRAQEHTLNRSSYIKSVFCVYRQILERKLIITSDGAKAEVVTARPEFGVVAIAKKGSRITRASDSVEITGGWKELFERGMALRLANYVADLVIRLLNSKSPRRGLQNVILAPDMTGQVVHEAIGHAAEADFVLSGSFLQGRLGQRISDERISIYDSSHPNIPSQPPGSIQVDDEGVVARQATIVKNGELVGFLHNRETASLLGAEPTGNARAYEFNYEPIIRMRNVYIGAGDSTFDEIIRETKHGYLVRGPVGGQSDSNGEFMVQAQDVCEIQRGKLTNQMTGATLSSNSVDFLNSIGAIGREVEFGAAGYCRKWQMAKVGGGGPYLSAKALLSGYNASRL